MTETCHELPDLNHMKSIDYEKYKLKHMYEPFKLDTGEFFIFSTIGSNQSLMSTDLKQVMLYVKNWGVFDISTSIKNGENVNQIINNNGRFVGVFSLLSCKTTPKIYIKIVKHKNILYCNGGFDASPNSKLLYDSLVSDVNIIAKKLEII